MSTLEILFAIITVVTSGAAVTVAIVAVAKINRVEVSFTGTPVDKKDFDAHVLKYETNNHAVWAKMEKDRMECAKANADLGASIKGIDSKTDMIIQFLKRGAN